MTPIALVIHPDGRLTYLPAPRPITLDDLYNAIGCQYVDCVRLTTRVDMWIDDEGLYNHPPNPIATALAHRYGHTHQTFHGPAVVAGLTDDGDTIGLTPDQVCGILAALADIAA